MSLNMKRLYKNWDFEIEQTSTIEKPRDNSLLLLRKEDADKLYRLNSCKYCVVVAEKGILPTKETAIYNFFLFDGNPEEKYRELAKLVENN